MNMRNVDRAILLVLAAGIWATILQPNDTSARDDNYHSCSGSGTGFGELDGDEVYVYQLDLDIECEHS